MQFIPTKCGIHLPCLNNHLTNIPFSQISTLFFEVYIGRTCVHTVDLSVYGEIYGEDVPLVQNCICEL